MSAVPGQAADSAERSFAFGPFRLLPTRRLLLEDKKTIRLGSRALEILIALVERPGDLFSKEALMARVWPNTFVEPANITVHVSALRRALGDGQGENRYIVNSPGRGYRFVAPVSVIDSTGSLAPQLLATEPTHNLPIPTTRLIGRADVIGTLAERLPQQRLITVAGAGGIGKTTVALATAEVLIPAYRDGVRFIDLAPVRDPLLVPSTLASVLGLDVHSENPTSQIVAFLRNKKMLLVLDSCDHVVETAALLAAEVLKGAAGVHVLATSREPLRTEGEHVNRLSPLGTPPVSARLTAAEALEFSAIQLFVERAAANLNEFELSDAHAPVVADICRKLDGLPLAIELAAARVEVFGVNQLAKGLDDRFQMLTSGRRSALPRHQTLRATFAWSYEYLPEAERVVLRRLSVFAGPFELKAAVAVVTSTDIHSTEIVDYIASLVSKSLISADVGGQIVHYRLLDTTRACALEKLAERGEVEQVARRHAEFYRDFFAQAEADWEQLTAERVADFSLLLADVRAALDWAFSPTGDLAIGVALTAASVPLWVQMSLLDECRRRVEQALSRLTVETEREARSEMKLYGAFGLASLFTEGPDLKTGTTWAKVQELADSLSDAEYQIRALWGQWVYCYGRGEHGAALSLARQLKTFAANKVKDRGDELIADRLIATSLHFLGDQINARRHIQHMLNGYAPSGNRSRSIRFGFYQEVQGRTTLARILCVQGFLDQAMHIAQSNVEDIPVNSVLSLCVASTEGTIPIALLVGNLVAAGRFLAMLLDSAVKHELTLWNRVGHCLKGMLLIKRGDVVNGVQLLRTSLDQLREIGYGLRRTDFLGALAEGLAAAGQVTEGLEIIQEALERSQREEERWNVAELLRIKGELVLIEDAPNAASSTEALFLESLDWARRQKALTWELRTGVSLARLQHAQNRTQEARNLLAPIYRRFNEGFEAADLKTANSLLERLA